MRRLLHICGIGILSLVSSQTIIALLDWLARWDWLKTFMDAHTTIATYIRTPISYVVLLVLGFSALSAERRLKQAHLVAKWTNWWFCPDLKTTTWGAEVDEKNKTPGWDTRPLNWHLFVEVQFANDSDTPATLEGAEAALRVGRFGKSVETAHMSNVASQIDRSRNSDGKYIADQFGANHKEALRSLMTVTRNTPLTKGIGHSGWLRFYVKNLCIRDKDNLRYDVFLLDALGEKHKVHYRKNSDKQWDKNFYIFPDY